MPNLESHKTGDYREILLHFGTYLAHKMQEQLKTTDSKTKVLCKGCVDDKSNKVTYTFRKNDKSVVSALYGKKLADLTICKKGAEEEVEITVFDSNLVALVESCTEKFTKVTGLEIDVRAEYKQ